MPDISSYVSAIKSAERGEIVRDSIIRALKTLNEGVSNAHTLEWHLAEYFATYIQVWNKQDKLTIDEVPTDHSSDEKYTNVVYSGGIWKYTGTFKTTGGETDPKPLPEQWPLE